MLILTLEELNNKFIIDDEARSNMKIEGIGRYISLIPKEIVMRHQKRDNIIENKFNFIGNLHPTGGTPCDLAIKRRW